MATGWATAATCAGVVLLASALYSPSLRSQFVYDADVQIGNDDNLIHDRSNLSAVLTLRVMRRDVLDFNRPVHLLVLMIDSMIWGRDPFGYHLTSILLHAANGGLLCYLLARYLAGAGVTGTVAAISAGAGAVIFAVHPVNTEAVAEPSYREDLLATFFILLTLLAATHYRPQRSSRNIAIGAGCVVCAFLAIASKESGIAAAALLWVYWWLMRRRERFAGWTALLIAASVAAGLFTAARFMLEPQTSVIYRAKPPILGGSVMGLVQSQPRIWALYFANLLWPVNLSADYTAFSIRGIGPRVAWPVVASVVAAQAWLAYKSRAAAMGVAIFWLALLPASNLLPMYRPIADRYLYAPMAGVACLAALGVASTWRWRWPRAGVTAVVIIAGVALAMLTINRQRVFHHSAALWRDTLVKNPASHTATDNLAFALLDEGKFKEAIGWWKETDRLTGGGEAEAYAGAALAFEALGRPAQADQYYLEAVRRDRYFADPQQLLRSVRWQSRFVKMLEPIAKRNANE
jgi:tetratricopeptide (TPR) repeat protein